MSARPFNPREIRAVAFDAYGTLFFWDFKEEVRTVMQLQSLEGDLDAITETFVKAWAKVSPWGKSVGEDGKPDRSQMLGGPVPEFIHTIDMWRTQFLETFRQHSLLGNHIEAADHLRRVLSRAPAYPDAFDTVERLAAHGYRLGLLSNADEDFVQSAISHNRLRFSVIQSSESLRAYKPNQTTFLSLCRRLECEPAEVLYVGDSAPTDVGGAAHAGLRTAWIKREAEAKYPEDQDPPDLQVTELAELLVALGIE